LAFGLLYLMFAPLESESWKTAGEIRYSLQLLPIVCAAYVFSWIVLTRERQGNWNRPAWFTNIGRFGAIRRIRSLESPAKALAWIEWKANGSVLAIVLLSLALPTALGRFGLIRPDWIHSLGVFSNLLLLPLILVFAGTVIARDCGARSLGLSPYIRVIPCSTENILISKLRTLGIIGILGLSVGLLHSWILSNAISDFVLWQDFGKQHSRDLEVMFLACLGAPLLTWNWLVGGFPIWLTGFMSSVVSAAAITLGTLLGVGSALVWIPQGRPELLIPLFWVLLALKLIVATSGFRICYRRGLLRISTIGFIIGIWTGIVLVSFILMNQLARWLIWPKELCLLAAVLICPLARIAFSPMALDYNRHH